MRRDPRERKQKGTAARFEHNGNLSQNGLNQNGYGLLNGLAHVAAASLMLFVRFVSVVVAAVVSPASAQALLVPIVLASGPLVPITTSRAA